MAEDTVHVVLTIKFDKETIARFEAISPRVKIHSQPAKQISDVPNRILKNAEVFYTSGVLPNAGNETQIKWVQCHFAGVDGILHHPFLEENPDIMVTSTRGIHASNIGEYVLGMLISLGHRLPAMMKDQREKIWSEDRYKRFVPTELRHSTVGILGYGAIGREVARLCKSFGAKVLATKRDLNVLEQEGFVQEGTGDPEGEFFDRLYPPQATRFMVKDCDFVVITLPYTEETANLYNAEIIAAMKPNSFLVNVGRGGIVDEDALVEALESGKIAGAAMDVFATEPLPSNHALWNAPNFILTPHLAGATADYNDKAAEVFEDNLRRYLEDRPLQNVVDRKQGY